MMIWKVTATTTLLAGTLGLVATGAHAELPPGSYDELRMEAEEALIIEVISGITRTLGAGEMEVVLKIKVLTAQRSKAGLKKDSQVTIRYVSFDQSKSSTFVPGAAPIPVLKKGRVYPAFLNRAKNRRDFEPAAYGWSFLMTPES